MPGLKTCKPGLSGSWASNHPLQTCLENTWKNMDHVKSLFSPFLWCAKASTVSQRLNKHFFKGYLDVSHLGGGVGAFNISAWIKVWRLPSLLPEHQDLWLHLGLCIPHSFSARGHPQEPTFLRLDCMCWGLQAAGWSWPMRTHCFWRYTQFRALVTRLQWQTALQVCCTQELYPRAVRCCYHPGA